MTDDWDHAREWAASWLHDAAFPLWYNSGWDRTFGGFHDKLDHQGEPLPLPKRLRVQARQSFAYCEAGRMGWSGPWRKAADDGIHYMLSRYRRDDGLFRASVSIEGEIVDDRPDLYDQAFVLFALAAGYAQLDKPAALLEEAEALLDTLERLLAHPVGGFWEGRDQGSLLRSNPHMHMLEALLAWVSAGGGERFAEKARELVTLATTRFLDPRTGAVGEYFDRDWTFAGDPQGSIREPGHQFEWAYLLREAKRVLGTAHDAASARLYAFGTRHGVVDGRVIFAVDPTGRPSDRSSRLWAQTERLRTALLAFGDGDQAAEAAAAESFRSVRRFLDAPVRGLWRERTAPDGSWIDEASPASSLYHILTGFGALLSHFDAA